VKRHLRQLASFFGINEVIFLIGMILLYSGVSVLSSAAWARSACGIILVVLALIKAREI
jgi:uncharacterized membrane protein YjdF